ncbi:MAG: 30S ribosomal protein S5 [Patescibacteria group bacterium]
MDNQEEKKIEERVLLIRRVSKKTTGGNYVTFSALVAVGDGQGRVGIGIGRSQEVPPAIKKAISYARKHMIEVPLFQSTIPHQIILKYKAARVLLKPAPQGTGLKVGSIARALLELSGVRNASGKIIGSRNQITNTYAIMKALSLLKARIIHEVKDKK